MPAAESSIAAEMAFYAAFSNGNLEQMMRVWADSATIFCIHPLGGVLLGHDKVRASWAEIFSAPVPRKLEIERLQVIQLGDVAIHVVLETVVLPANYPRVMPIAAANTFRLLNGVWKMVIHHASPIGYVEPTISTQIEPPPTRH